MNTYSRYPCQLCQSKRGVLFCRECTQLTCNKCVNQISIIDWYCGNCENHCSGEFCGSCGSSCRIINRTAKQSCPNCRSILLGDPSLLLNNLQSEFFSIITKLNNILPEILELHRTFDFFVTLVRLCRLAGLLGFPQIEDQLDKCSKGLTLITKNGINQLSKVRQEVIFDLKHIQYFNNIKLEHYRNAETILSSTTKSIQQVSDLIQYWINEIKIEFEKLRELAFPLKKHYELLSEISRNLQEKLTNVAALVPPVGMKISTRKQTFRSQAYIIFSDEQIICLPEEIKNPRKRGKKAQGIKFNYEKILDISVKHSVIKGSRLIINLMDDQIKINSSPHIIEILKKYFDLILSGEPYFVGSAKRIVTIEENAPNKNEYKSAINRFISFFREHLFGIPDQKPPQIPFQSSSIQELRKRIGDLQENVRDLDHQAKNRLVNYGEYQSQRSQIKEDLRSIQDNINSYVDNSVGNYLGGHLAKDMNSNKWVSSTDLVDDY